MEEKKEKEEEEEAATIEQEEQERRNSCLATQRHKFSRERPGNGERADGRMDGWGLADAERSWKESEPSWRSRVGVAALADHMARNCCIAFRCVFRVGAA